MRTHEQEKLRRATAPFHVRLWRLPEHVNSVENPPPYCQGWGPTAREALLDALGGDEEEASYYTRLQDQSNLLIKGGYIFGLVTERSGNPAEF